MNCVCGYRTQHDQVFDTGDEEFNEVKVGVVTKYGYTQAKFTFLGKIGEARVFSCPKCNTMQIVPKE